MTDEEFEDMMLYRRIEYLFQAMVEFRQCNEANIIEAELFDEEIARGCDMDVEALRKSSAFNRWCKNKGY